MSITTPIETFLPLVQVALVRRAEEQAARQIDERILRAERIERMFEELESATTGGKVTPVEAARIRELHEAGLTAAETAADMDRRQETVRSVRAKMKLRAPLAGARPSELRDRIDAMLREGRPQTEIAEATGVGLGLVELRQQRIATGAAPRLAWTEEKNAELRRLAAEGLRNAEIARRLKVSTWTVYQHRRAMGIPAGRQEAA